MGLRPTNGDESGCYPEPFAVTLSEAKGLSPWAFAPRKLMKNWVAQTCRRLACLRHVVAGIGARGAYIPTKGVGTYAPSSRLLTDPPPDCSAEADGADQA